jgi:phosphatidate cytidylyltransferase
MMTDTSTDSDSSDRGAPPPNSSGELGKRVVSGAVMAAAALGTAWLGGVLFLLVWTAAAFIVFWEWTGIIKSAPRSLLIAIGTSAIAGAAISLFMGAPAIALICAVIGAGVAAASAQPGRVWAAAGVLYAAAVVVPVAMLRDAPALGFAAVLWLFAVVWAEDIVAYFAGKMIGGPKLAPRISPKKTWSGAIGGTVASVVAGCAVVYGFGITVRPAHVVLAIAVSIAAQCGDLLESWIKRRLGVKDSSGLIPGHGGAMDRLDGFIIASLVALAIGLWRGGASTPATGLLSW